MLTACPHRRLWFVLIALLGLLAGTSALPRMVIAQDDAAQGDEKVEKVGDGQKVERTKETQSTLAWIVHTSGIIGGFLLILSIYFVSTVIRLFLEFRPQVAAPSELVDECEDLLQKRQFKEIYNVVKDDPSLFASAVSTGIAELPNGLAEARDAMERVGESATVDMEKKISMLAVLGTLGPMIGLLGTLKGMIASFGVIARGESGLDASEIAKGISEALLLTFEGVLLSVPSIYFFALFRNRVMTLSVNTLLQADEFLRHFAHAARSKAPVAGPVAPVAAAPVAAAAGKAPVGK
jgi:biopolymer transport protein ExbB